MKTWKLLFVAFITLVLTSQSAFASTIDVTYNGSANFGAGGVGYPTGQIFPYPGGSGFGSVGLGGDNFITSNTSYNFSSTGTFNTWCVDITHWLIGGTVTYDVLTANELAGVFGTTRVNDLQKLANQVYSMVDTTEESAAFQIATWAIMFSTPTALGQYSLNSASFVSTANNPGNSMAQTWLNQLGSNNTFTGNYSITYLTQPVGAEIPGNTQDMVVFTQTPVPEPGTMLLLGVGMFGLAVFGKRRMNRNE